MKNEILRAPRGTPKSYQNPSKDRSGARFFRVRPCSLAFYWFSVEFYAKYTWKTGRPCQGICIIAHDCLKIRMSILYCKNQYKTHFFQDWRSGRNIERSKTYGQNRWTKLRSQRNRLGVRILLIFWLFCINFWVQMPPEPVFKAHWFFHRKNGRKKTLSKRPWEAITIIGPANCPPQGSSGG